MNKPLYTPAAAPAILLILLDMLIGMTVLISVEPVLVWLKINPGTPWVDGATSIITLVLLLLLLRRKYRLDLLKVMKPTDFKFSLLMPIIVTVLGAGIVSSELGNHVLKLFPISDFWLDLFMSFDPLIFGYPAVIFSVALTGPIIEEILFRGLILRGLLQHYRPWTAVLISALLFALIHGNPWQFPIALIMGTLFGWWFYRTNSLIPCIAGHVFNNGFPYLLTFIGLNIPGYTVDAAFQPLWFTMTGVGLLFVGILWCRTSLNRHYPKADAVTPEVHSEPAEIQ